MLPPPCFTVGMVFFGLQVSLFSSEHNDGHYGQTVLFMFYQTRGHFSKKYDLCPNVQLQTVFCLFYGGFEAVASSLLSGLSGHVDIGHGLLWLSILLLVFPPASSPGPLLGFWEWFVLCSPKYVHLSETDCVSFLSGRTAAWAHGVNTWVLLFVQMNVVPSGVWKLLPFF